MKKLTFLLILVLGITMSSCGPTQSQRQRVVTQYLNQTNLFGATFEGDSVPFMYYHAYNKYEALKAFDEQLAESECTRKYVIEEYWTNGSNCK